MVLGLLFGHHVENDTPSKMRANQVNDTLMERFAKVCGSYKCNELLKCDISTKDGIEFAKENRLFTEFCPRMVANAVDILEEIIQEQKYSGLKI